MKLLFKEPMLALGAVVALIGVIGTFGLPQFTADNAQALVVVLMAIAAAIGAWTTRPIAVGPFAALISALISFGVSYGFSLPTETVLAINSAVYPILVFLTRGQVSPIETAITKASEDPLAWPRSGESVAVTDRLPNASRPV